MAEPYIDIADVATVHRLPPQNIEAEQSVLGSMLISNEAVAEVTEFLKAEDFYRAAHRRIFEAILRLNSQSEAIDVITVVGQLKADGQLEDVGGHPYLHTLVSMVPTAANARHYARLIEKAAILRALIETGTIIAGLGYEESEDPSESLGQAEALVYQLNRNRTRERFSPIKEVLHETMERIEQLYEHGSGSTGLSVGFRDLDDKLGGLQPSDLVIIAARPSMGKTSLALNIAQNVAMTGKGVALFSLEMSKKQLAQRLICAEARVDAHALRTGGLSDADWDKLVPAIGRLAEAPIFIDDSAAISAAEVKAKARRLASRRPLDLIVIDYLQLMQGHRRSENRQQEISEITRSLKIIGRELEVPVVALSQLSRAVEQREHKRPQLADLRESGAIEQDADVVMFIYRDDYYHDDSDDRGKAEIIIAKHRNGPTGKVELTFLSRYARFGNLARSDA